MSTFRDDYYTGPIIELRLGEFYLRNKKRCAVFPWSFSINLLAFFNECRSLIGYTTRSVFKPSRVFLSRIYWLMVDPQKFDVLKANICSRSEASRAKMLVLRTSNLQGVTIIPIVPTLNCLYCSPLNFLPCASSKIN